MFLLPLPPDGVVNHQLKDTSTALARAITGILNAPLITLYTFAYAITMLHPQNASLLLLLTAFFGMVLPMGIIYYMLKKGLLKDIYASDRQTRFQPFIGAVLSYLLGLVALVVASAPDLVSVLMAGYLVNTIIMMLITLRWKISIHASGIAGPATYLAYAFGIHLWPVFLLIIPVGWARLKLKAHTLSQVVVGFLLTVVLTYVQLFIYLG
jgi:membrane-associated phospholipid phosphatase